MNVLAISGSLRQGSFNTKLLRTASELAAGDGVAFDLWEGLKAIPPYDEDDDVEGGSPAVSDLRAAVAGADALLFATPEYNRSIPGHLKNAIDWLSRPLATSPLRDKPVAVVGASAGAFGAVWGQAELRKVLAATGARVIEAEVAVGRAPQRFDADGRLADEDLRRQLADVVGGLVSAVAARHGAPPVAEDRRLELVGAQPPAEHQVA
jgi:chromate reductase, NAD(P)H dehydrogenase (quinone)